MSGRGTIGYVSGSATEQIYTYASEPIPTIVRFTTVGANSYTVPTGVTYIVANIIGGGGGTGLGATTGGDGTASSVAFAAGTKTAAGGKNASTTATTNSGNSNSSFTSNAFGGGAVTVRSGSDTYTSLYAGDGTYLRTGGAVTPGATLTVTVGSGGTAGTNGNAGKQGIVWLEYYAANKRRVESFQSSGTFNPPSGVTTVNAFIRGGGGGTGWGDGGGGDGGTSSVAFTAGTQSGLGGKGIYVGRGGFIFFGLHVLGADNSGQGGFMAWATTSGPNSSAQFAQSAETSCVQGTVAFGTGVTITVGAGGSSQTGASGSGLVWIEYDLP